MSKYCVGRKCDICHAPAKHKVEEVLFDDDPTVKVEVSPGIFSLARHPLTAYLCDKHFYFVMGEFNNPVKEKNCEDNNGTRR